MEPSRLLACLDADFTALRAAVVAADPAATVPSCPDWTVSDLALHTATVFAHKTVCILTRADPESWPPSDLPTDPLTALDTGYADLLAAFAGHSPADPAKTWYGPDQTVGFWIRRMAQETVIHRVDAELAAGLPLSPIPDDLAVDGVDEVLEMFLGYDSVTWPEAFGELLAEPDSRPVVLRTADRAWTATAGSDGVRITAGAAPDAAAEIHGDPAPLLLWLWNRADTGVDARGDGDLLARFHRLRVIATQ